MISKLIDALFASPSAVAPKEHQLELAIITLMIEVIKADHKVEEREQQGLVRAVEKAFQLPSEKIKQLIEEANQLAHEATSLWEHTKLVNEQCSEQDKYQLVKGMWQIAYADGNIHRYEEHIIRRVSDLIYLPHTLFIKAKHEAFKLVGLEN